MERSATSPDDHIRGLPDGVRDDIAALDEMLSDIFRGHERVLWEGPMWGGTHQRIVGYGALRSPRPGGDVDWFMIGLAAQRSYLSLYVSAVEDGQYLVKRYADRLGKVKVGSANVTFKRVADLDLAAVREMATRACQLLEGAAG